MTMAHSKEKVREAIMRLHVLAVSAKFANIKQTAKTKCLRRIARREQQKI